VVPFVVATAGGAIGLVLVITQVVEPDPDETVAAPAAD
jgi:hypothetical protein